MAFSVRVPKEIEDYQVKIIGGLSARKLISFVSALIIGGLTFVVCKFLVGLSIEISGYFVMAAVILPFAFGFFKKDGCTFEEFIPLVVRYYFGQKIRRYENVTPCHTRKEKNREKCKKRYRVCEYYNSLTEKQKNDAVAKAKRIAKRTVKTKTTV